MDALTKTVNALKDTIPACSGLVEMQNTPSRCAMPRRSLHRRIRDYLLLLLKQNQTPRPAPQSPLTLKLHHR